MNKKVTEEQAIESDVVVVGYGGAGAAAAITAHDSGAGVIILEKMPAGGGNTRVCGGGVLSPTGMEAIDHIEALCQGSTERDVIEAFVKNAIHNKDWIKQTGGAQEKWTVGLDVLYPRGTMVSWPQVVGAQSIEKVHMVTGRDEPKSKKLWEFFSTSVERRPIKVMTGTPARELVTNEKGEVTGVIAEKEGRRISVVAKRAVILTCGGFEYNTAMREAFLPFKPAYAFGNPGNTGDGIIMAQKVGAALWHMTQVSGYYGFKAPEYEAAFPLRWHSEKFIFVNQDGKRFVSETGVELHHLWRPAFIFDTNRLRYLHSPAYAVFDEACTRKGALFQGTSGYNRDAYKWSLDNSKEVSKGWISQGKTVADLARKISIDETALKETVDKYNEFCKLGKDADFLRPRETLGAIETSPFYAIKLWPCLLNTQGGPRRDKEARVLDHDGKPIPRLYSAGELGSLWGFLYQGSGNVGECVAFGRIAGTNAAAEKPWR